MTFFTSDVREQGVVSWWLPPTEGLPAVRPAEQTLQPGHLSHYLARAAFWLYFEAMVEIAVNDPELPLNPPEPSDSQAPPRSERKWIIALAAAIAVIAIGGIALYPFWRAQPAASLVGGPFKLQGPDGRVVTDADMKGEPFLVYFGYANCPDVCPTTLAAMSDVLKRMPDKPIRALFITIDPERDTAQSLKDYLASFDPRIIGLSGDSEAIGRVEKAYRVYARKGPPEKGGYSMDHSSIIYLMDAKGRFVEALDLERKPEETARELEAYL